MNYEYSLESPYVYDKMKYHYGADDFPEDADEIQAGVHTGLYFGWLAENGFLIQDDKESNANIEKFLNRDITGPELYQLFGEALIDYMINPEGNLFSLEYFDFEEGEYLDDYEEHLAQDFDSIYLVQDTWENYQKMKVVIDQRYQNWKTKNS